MSKEHREKFWEALGHHQKAIVRARGSAEIEACAAVSSLYWQFIHAGELNRAADAAERQAAATEALLEIEQARFRDTRGITAKEMLQRLDDMAASKDPAGDVGL